MPQWRVQLLGGMRISGEERVVSRFRTRSADSVFAYLALNLGHEVRRERLIDLVWPGADARLGQQNLRTALSSIRSVLGPNVLRADRATVQLTPDCFEVDAIAFRRTRDVSLYRGRLLEGLDDGWILPIAVELEDLHVRSLIERMGQLPPAEARELAVEALKRDPGSAALRAKLRDIDPAGAGPSLRAAPYLVSSFIGRERELGELARLLEHNRLVTLTGMGGSGKTRLAAELWSRSRPESWFVSMREVTDPDAIGDALRQGLRLPASSALRGIDHVKATLQEETGLLVVDNFEQVLEGASVIEELLVHCPALRVVVTSRVGLRLEGEIEFRVGSLALTPESDGAISESAQLFEARARAVVPEFSVNSGNARAVMELCARLDGFPLSLEFAAAKSRIFTPDEMLKQLNDRFDFLSFSEIGQGRRHTSLLDALDWSFDRLSEADQLLLCRLSVFEGGFTLDAAAKVCGAAASGVQIETLLMSAWLERALGSESTRFRLLESIRDYASALLIPRDRAEVERAHASYYLALARRCMEASFMPDEPAQHRLVRDDIHNIDAAWRWLQAHDPEGALEIVCSLNWYWILGGQANLGEARLRDALSKVSEEPRPILGRAMHHRGNFVMFQGRFSEAEQWFRRAFEMTEVTGDTLFRGLAACQIGRVLSELGDEAGAREYVATSVGLLIEFGDENWICAGYTIQVLIANRFGWIEQALESGRTAVEYGRRGGYRWGLASALNELAMACHLAGDYRASVIYQLESIEIKRDQEALPSHALSLADLAATRLAMGEVGEAKEALRDCATILLRLNDFDNMARVFATGAELLWLSDQADLASRSLAKFLELTRVRKVSFSESEAYDRARKLVGEASSPGTQSRLLIEALANL